MALAATLPSVAVIDDPVRAASVLNPDRLRLLGALDHPDSATGVARRLGLARQAVNYHIRQLESDGLVNFVEERRRRGCVERIVQASAASYVISPAALGALASDPERVRDQFSSAYLIAVAGSIIRNVGDLRRMADAAQKQLATLTIQTEVRFASQADQHAFSVELREVMARLARRYHNEAAPHARAFSFVSAVYPKIEPHSEVSIS